MLAYFVNPYTPHHIGRYFTIYSCLWSEYFCWKMLMGFLGMRSHCTHGHLIQKCSHIYISIFLLALITSGEKSLHTYTSPSLVSHPSTCSWNPIAQLVTFDSVSVGRYLNDDGSICGTALTAVNSLPLFVQGVQSSGSSQCS